jgi:threonine dehydrogenase-like Zn-dependent dehydrogenase
MGHEFAGVVEEIGERSNGMGIGDRVVAEPSVACGVCEQCSSGRTNVCRLRRHVGLDFPGAFADYVKMPSLSCHLIPESLSPATLAEPLSVGTHSVRLASIGGRDVVLILGSGVIGLSCLVAAREKAKTVLVTDLFDSRLGFAKSLGADAVIDASRVDPVKEVQRLSSETGVNVAIEAVGLEKTVNQAISSVKEAGRLILVGLLDETARVGILQITVKEIQVSGSYGRTSKDFNDALTLLERNLSKISTLVTHTFSLTDVSQAFETASKEKQRAIKVLLVP